MVCIHPQLSIKFMLGGNARFNLEREKTCYSYHITRKHTTDNSKVWRVHVVRGNKDYYTGYIKVVGNKLKYRHNANWGDDDTDAGIYILTAFIRNRNNPNNDILMYHTGRCGCCGRLLTDKKAIERGFGHECWSRMMKGGSKDGQDS